MFRASLCPSSGEQDRVLPHKMFCTGSLVVLAVVGCDCVELLTTRLHTTTANHNQHNQCKTPYAEVHGLVLLMMGIMMTEIC